MLIDVQPENYQQTSCPIFAEAMREPNPKRGEGVELLQPDYLQPLQAGFRRDRSVRRIRSGAPATRHVQDENGSPMP